MGEPVYAKEGPGLVAKVIALSMAGIFVWYAIDIGSYRSMRGIFILVIPLGLIWYPETICAHLSRWFSVRFVYWIGWILLATLMMLPLLSWLKLGSQ